ncbi:paired mesoderm homeobox protein 2-like isoform X2 [Pelodiscus sinensis]|uniref:paired mesoderm homeobox protein 2-like isoform X2 n=1 Tax=Pelodiscus sinensis TaxID=13735 RepID=UPI003F6C20A7
MDSAPELQEAFSAMTPELWELIPLALDRAHLNSYRDWAASQPLSAGPANSRHGPGAGAEPGLADSGMDAMALPPFPTTAAGPRAVSVAPDRDHPHTQGGGQQGRKKRKRNLYSCNQLRILESFFQRKKYPNLPEAEMLSGMTGLTYQQIRVWFQNRRGKHRRLYAGDRTLGSSLSALQPRPYAEPAHGPLSPFDWPANPVCSGPDPALPWALQGPASSAFDSRVHLPPCQTAPSPTDFQAYNSWAPQSIMGTSPPAMQPVTINSSFLHFSGVQSMECGAVTVNQCW